MKKEKGFTLIELLVVVSVIAILASTVLVNLRGARERAMDTRIIMSLGQIRGVATIIHSRTGSYAALCAASPAISTLAGTDGLLALRDDIDTNNGAHAPAVCIAAGNDYCVSSQLNETATAFWCITSRGRSARTAASCTTAATSTGSCGGL